MSSNEHSSAPQTKTFRWKTAFAGVALLAALLLFRPFHARAKSDPPPHSALTVAAAKVERTPMARELVFDSEFRPYQEIDLHAKVAGYLQSITVDIGDTVKEGQLIAQLELPEVENDLQRAAASQRRYEEDIKRAEAAYEEARVSHGRLASIDKAQPHLIAQQDLDTATAKEKTAFASLAATREEANVASAEAQKLQTMLKYARITAPFAGVITKRYADKGSLIPAGISSSTQALPLVRLSETDKLRLSFPVSVSYVSQIHVGQPVQVRVPSLKRVIPAIISRSAQRMDMSTRTMETEVDLPNPGCELIPGMYASVTLEVDQKTNALTVPVQALARGKSGATVVVISPQGILEERRVELGLESPSRVEVLSGVHEDELVMIGSRTQVKSGQKVIAKAIDLPSNENL
jgi:RND family efflux transporter MFP subunit